MSIEAAYLRDPDLNVELLAMRDEHGATFEVQRSLVLDDAAALVAVREHLPRLVGPTA